MALRPKWHKLVSLQYSQLFFVTVIFSWVRVG